MGAELGEGDMFGEVHVMLIVIVIKAIIFSLPVG